MTHCTALEDPYLLRTLQKDFLFSRTIIARSQTRQLRNSAHRTMAMVPHFLATYAAAWLAEPLALMWFLQKSRPLPVPAGRSPSSAPAPPTFKWFERTGPAGQVRRRRR